MRSGRRRRGFLTRVKELVWIDSHLYARATGARVVVAPPYCARLATPSDLARLEADLAEELTATKADLIRRRAGDASHQVAVVALPNGEICGYGHIAHGRIEDDHLRFDLGPQPGVAHLFDDFVASAHRGHRLQVALLTLRLDAAEARRAQVATILVADTNHASRASVLAAGFRPVLRIVTLRGPAGRRSWALGVRPKEKIRASGSWSPDPR